MNKPNNKSTEIRSKHLRTGRKNLFIGGVIAPFLFYSYEYFPKTKILETPFFESETSFRDWNAYAWYMTGKLIPFYLLLLWFASCRHWWYWIILVPIAMYAFQIWGLIVESNEIDENEIFYVLPIMMVIVPLVYLIRAKIFNKIRGDDLKSFEEELMVKKSSWQQLKDLFR